MAIVIKVTRETLFNSAKFFMRNCDVLLDIGPGIRPFDLIQSRLQICVEPCQEYIEHYELMAKKGKVKDRIFLNKDWEQITDILPEQSVDSIVLMDVIEHLPKEDGKRLLTKSEKIARNQVIIFTPLGFMPQCHPDGIDAWGLGGGKFQEHKSGWLPSDFDDRYLVLVADDYHKLDHAGVPFETPYGAFFAIKIQ